MGNCIRKESSTQWGGEDWGSFGSDREIGNSKHEDYSTGSFIEDKSRGFGETKIGVLSSGLPAGTEVKIRISKKRLEQLLKKAEFGGASAGQLLARLVDDGDDLLEAHRRPWRPELQSIPE